MLQASFNGRIARQFRSVMVAVVCSFCVGDSLMGVAAALLYAAQPSKAHDMRVGFPKADVLLFFASFFGMCPVPCRAPCPAVPRAQCPPPSLLPAS